jgi:hypothetical protein
MGAAAFEEQSCQRSCCITVDSAMAASQNGFCSYKLTIYKKTNIMQIMTILNIFIYLIFYHREIVTILWHFPWVMQTPFCDVMQPLQNPQFCSSTLPTSKQFFLFDRAELHQGEDRNEGFPHEIPKASSSPFAS